MGNPTKKCHYHQAVRDMLNQTNKQPPQLSAMRALYPRKFQEVVQCEHNASQIVLDGINANTDDDKSVFWGYKNPRHSYILPALFGAFGSNTAMIFVVRHPYDICSGRNQKQFHSYGLNFASARTDSQGNWVAPSCMEFWFEATRQILSLIEKHPGSARIVRVESLVLGSSKQRNATGKCIADVVGYRYDHNAAREATSIMSQHKKSYGGQSRSDISNDRSLSEQQQTSGIPNSEFRQRHYWWKESVNETTKEMHELAWKLGYNLTAYGGTLKERDEFLVSQATSTVVC